MIGDSLRTKNAFFSWLHPKTIDECDHDFGHTIHLNPTMKNLVANLSGKPKDIVKEIMVEGFNKATQRMEDHFSSKTHGG